MSSDFSLKSMLVNKTTHEQSIVVGVLPEMSVLFRLRHLLATLLCCLPLATPAQSAPPAHSDLIIGLSQFPTILHPSIESMIVKAYVLGFVHRPITAYDADWKLVCLMCTKLPTLENGLAKTEPGGGMAVTFTLPADAFWADGRAVSTDDVLFSWEVGKHPQSGVANAAIYRAITAIDTRPDKKTFTVHLAQATSTYNVLTDFRVLPAHVEKAAFANPDQYRKQSLYMAAPTTAGLYDGPYRVAEVVTGSHVVLERNAFWKGKAPAFDRIVLRTMENTQALQAALLSGQINMIAGEMGLPLDQAVPLANRLPAGLHAQFKPGLVYEHLDVNPANPILADVRVRKALLYGINREAISREMFGGKLPVADSSISALEPIYAPTTKRYSYDPRRAGALLDEAGWKSTGRGPRRNAAGQPLIIDLGTTAGNHSRELIQQVISAQLRPLGVEIRPFTEISRSFFADRVTKRAFTGMVLYSWFGTPGQVPRSTLHSAFIPNPENNFSGQNFTGYANPRMDQLIEALDAELDPAKRADLWRQLQELYADDLPALPLFFTTAAFFQPGWLQGLRPTGHDAPTSLWVADWTVQAAAEQR